MEPLPDKQQPQPQQQRQQQSGDEEAPPPPPPQAGVAGTGDTGEATERTPLIRRKSHASNHASGEGGKFVMKPLAFYDRWLMRHKNAEFADAIEMALRAAIAICLFKTPELFGVSFASKVSSDLPGLVKRYEMLSPEAIVMLIYMLYRTVGETVYFIWTSFFGIVLGSFWPWFMFGVFQSGVQPHHGQFDPVSIFGMVVGQGFIVGLLFFNFDINTKIFAGCTFAWHWMSFMHPHSGAGYNKGFNLDLGVIGLSLMQGFFGCVIAFLITLLPFPITSARKARHCAKAIVREAGCTWACMINFNSAASADAFMLGDLHNHHRQLQSQVDSLMHYVDSALWEAFCNTNLHRMRHMMKVFHLAMLRVKDCLTSIAMFQNEQDWDRDHQEFMQTCGPALSDVCNKSTLLLAKVVQLMCKGRPPQLVVETQTQAEADVAALKKSMSSLAAVNRSCRSSEEGIKETLIDEHSLCVAVTAYARQVIELANYAYDPKFDEKLPHQRTFVEGFKADFGDIFSSRNLFTPHNINFTFRNSLTIFLCFFIGLRGYSSMLPAWSAGPSSTAAILLSDLPAASSSLNMSRLQGVICGLILGQFGYALFGWCEVWAGFVRLIISFAYLTINLYLYYSGSKKFAMFCLYSAAFGSKYFFEDCSPAVQDPTKLVHSMVEIIVCIVVMSFVDMSFTAARPSRMAYEAVLDIAEILSDATIEVCDTMLLKESVHQKLLGKVNAAIALNAEAESEMRAWREPWKAEVFRVAIDWSRAMTACLELVVSTTHASVSASSRASGVRILHDSLQEMPEFGRLTDALRANVERVPDMLEALNMDRAKWKKRYGEKMQADLAQTVQDCILVMCKSASAVVDKDSDAGGLLDEDNIARLCTILQAMECMAKSMRRLRIAAVKG